MRDLRSVDERIAVVTLLHHGASECLGRLASGPLHHSGGEECGGAAFTVEAQARLKAICERLPPAGLNL